MSQQLLTSGEMRCFGALELDQGHTASYLVGSAKGSTNFRSGSVGRQQQPPPLNEAIIRITRAGITVLRTNDRVLYCTIPWDAIEAINRWNGLQPVKWHPRGGGAGGQQHRGASPQPTIPQHGISFVTGEGSLEISCPSDRSASALLKAVCFCAADGTDDGVDESEDASGVDEHAANGGTATGAAHKLTSHMVKQQFYSNGPTTAATAAAAIGTQQHQPLSSIGRASALQATSSEEHAALERLRRQSEAMRRDIQPPTLRSTSGVRSTTPSTARGDTAPSGGHYHDRLPSETPDADARRRLAAQQRAVRSGSIPRSEASTSGLGAGGLLTNAQSPLGPSSGLHPSHHAQSRPSPAPATPGGGHHNPNGLGGGDWDAMMMRASSVGSQQQQHQRRFLDSVVSADRITETIRAQMMSEQSAKEALYAATSGMSATSSASVIPSTVYATRDPLSSNSANGGGSAAGFSPANLGVSGISSRTTAGAASSTTVVGGLWSPEEKASSSSAPPVPRTTQSFTSTSDSRQSQAVKEVQQLLAELERDEMDSRLNVERFRKVPPPGASSSSALRNSQLLAEVSRGATSSDPAPTPSLVVGSSEMGSTTASSDEKRDRDSSTSAPPPSATLGDWTRTIDASSGRYCYFNVRTHAMTFDAELTSFATRLGGGTVANTSSPNSSAAGWASTLPIVAVNGHEATAAVVIASQPPAPLPPPPLTVSKVPVATPASSPLLAEPPKPTAAPVKPVSMESSLADSSPPMSPASPPPPPAPAAKAPPPAPPPKAPAATLSGTGKTEAPIVDAPVEPSPKAVAVVSPSAPPPAPTPPPATKAPPPPPAAAPPPPPVKLPPPSPAVTQTTPEAAPASSAATAKATAPVETPATAPAPPPVPAPTPAPAPPPKAPPPPPAKAPPPPAASASSPATPSAAPPPPPPAKAPPPPSPSATGAAPSEATAKPAAAPPAANDVPVQLGDWKRAADPASGRTYFVNIVTKAKTWKKEETSFAGIDLTHARPPPNAGAKSAAEASAVSSPAAAAAATAANAETTTATGGKEPVVVGDWKRSWDAASSRFYYTNLLTKAKSWKPEGTPWENGANPTPTTTAPSSGPAASGSATSSAPASPSASSPARIKDGWKAMKTAEGRPYYVEIATKRTTWKAAETPFKDDP